VDTIKFLLVKEMENSQPPEHHRKRAKKCLINAFVLPGQSGRPTGLQQALNPEDQFVFPSPKLVFQKHPEDVRTKAIKRPLFT